MEKKTILAIFLIIIVFFVSRLFFPTPTVAEKAKELQKQETLTAPTKTTEETPTPTKKYIPDNLVEEQNVSVNNSIVLENDKIRVVFSNKGGVIKDVFIKGYFISETQETVNLIKDYAYNITVDGESYINKVFNYSNDGKSITFYLKGVRKVFTISNEYSLNLQISLYGKPINRYSLDIGSGIKDSETVTKDKSRDYGITAMVNNQISKIYHSKLKKDDRGISIDGNVSWIAAYSKYFVIGVLPEKAIDMFSANSYSTDDAPAFSVNIRDNRTDFTHNYTLYFGTMETANMLSLGAGFEKIASRTWKALDWLSKIFIKLLAWLYAVIPNYGVAIILFAIILKLLLYPLTHKMYESTQKMQLIQPKVAELQRRFKSDKANLNVELRKLYKQEGVNPLGGCLPLLLQMPIFFALYPALKYSIGLRQASFGWWLKDLSVSDPYMILPVLMGFFMFLQQKLMMNKKQPSTMDNKQRSTAQTQKMMMYMMPILMVVIFRNLPAGLVMYWTVFNVLSIIQQVIINKRFGR